MRHSEAAILLGFALVAACGGGEERRVQPDQELVGGPSNATLYAGEPGRRGPGEGERMDGREKGEATKTRAVVSIQNAVPGGEHPWHVHLGQCGDDRGIFGPADAYGPLQVGSNGQAQESAVLSVPVPVAGQDSINVHASRNNMKTIIGCGNLAPPS